MRVLNFGLRFALAILDLLATLDGSSLVEKCLVGAERYAAFS